MLGQVDISFRSIQPNQDVGAASVAVELGKPCNLLRSACWEKMARFGFVAQLRLDSNQFVQC